MKKLLLYSSVCLLTLLFLGCTQQGNGKLPKVKTGNVRVTSFRNNYQGVSYACGLIGGLVEANGAVVVKYGVCYSTTNNKPTMYNDEYPNSDSYELSHVYGTLSGSQTQFVYRYFEIPLGGNTKIYARAYALTADGEEVYGKTITFELNDIENQQAFLLSRTGGWKLISSSAPLSHGEPENHTIFFDRDGTCYHTISEHFEESKWECGCFGLNYPENINSEIIPEINCLRYNIIEDDGYSLNYYKAEIINLTNNELKIRRYETNDVNCNHPNELTYVPAP